LRALAAGALGRDNDRPQSKAMPGTRYPTAAEFQDGCRAFRAREKRDAMYRVATFLVEHNWGKPADMADALGVLLLTWNQAFYRYGSLDFENLERCLVDHQQQLRAFRRRPISSYTAADDPEIRTLFEAFLIALQLSDGPKKGTGSPVSVAKALHLLAPGFFPLWDARIAKAYGCRYAARPADGYLRFLRSAKEMAKALEGRVALPKGKTLLKAIDEYNYAKFTKKWV
jgi:hypothetical protein